MEASLRKMDAMVATTAIAITNTLPASANEGDLYLVGTAPTGVAAGWANRIARWKGSPAGWEAFPPLEGWIITVVGESTNKIRGYNGTAWIPIIEDIGAEPVLPAGGTANDYLTGAKVWANLASAVCSVVLTGLSTASSAVVVATDTILQAIGKLQAQVALRLTIANPTFIGMLSGPSAKFSVNAQEVLTLVRPTKEVENLHGVDFSALNSSTTETVYAKIRTRIVNSTAGSETSEIQFYTKNLGVETKKFGIYGDYISFGAVPIYQNDGSRQLVDANGKGTFQGLDVPSGVLSVSQFGVLREYFATPTTAALYPTGVTPSAINYVLAFSDSGAQSYLNASNTVHLSVGDTPKLQITASAVTLASAIPLYQGVTERITAGGGGRFTEVRLSSMVGSAGYLPRLDANGELIASGILEDMGDLGGASTLRTALSRPLKLNQAGGSWGGSSYTSWSPSIYLPIADDSLGNTIAGTASGWMWNSQRANAITICDGAASAPFRGRVKAGRWNGYSAITITGTTSATSFFAAGTGDGTPTVPANYLTKGRSGKIKAVLTCISTAASSTHGLALKFGSTAVWTTTAGAWGAGVALLYVIEADFYLDDSGWLNVIGKLEMYQNGTFNQQKPILYAAAFDATTSKTIDATITPYATSESFVRALAILEI